MAYLQEEGYLQVPQVGHWLVDSLGMVWDVRWVVLEIVLMVTAVILTVIDSYIHNHSRKKIF